MVVLTLWNYQIVNTSKQKEAQLEQLVINQLLIYHQLSIIRLSNCQIVNTTKQEEAHLE